MQQTSEWLLCARPRVRDLADTEITPYALGLKILTLKSRGERHKQTLCRAAMMAARTNHSDHTREKERLGLQVGERGLGARGRHLFRTGGMAQVARCTSRVRHS